MGSQSIDVLEALVPKWPAVPGREFYEDQDARISIMARANAQGPDTLLQACLRPTRTNPLADRGRPMHSVHTTHSGVLSQSPTREQPHPARLRAGRRAIRHSIAKMDGTR